MEHILKNHSKLLEISLAETFSHQSKIFSRNIINDGEKKCANYKKAGNKNHKKTYSEESVSSSLNIYFLDNLQLLKSNFIKQFEKNI